MSAIAERARRHGLRRRIVMLLSSLTAVGVLAGGQAVFSPAGDRKPNQVARVTIGDDDTREPRAEEGDEQRSVRADAPSERRERSRSTGTDARSRSASKKDARAVAALGLRGRLAYTAQGIRVLDLAAGRDTAVTEAGSDPALSPDGSRIAYARPVNQAGLEATLHVTGSDGRGDREIFARSGARVSEPAWSPDAGRIALVLVTSSAESWTDDGWPDSNSPWAPADRRELWVVDADGTDAHRIDATVDRFPGGPAWSPDGNRLAFSDDSGPGEVYVLDLRSGQMTQVAKGTNPAWAPDGRRIAVAHNFAIDVVNTDDLSVEKTIQRQGSHTYWEPAWSPDGGWLAFWRQNYEPANQSPPSICVVRPDGRDLRVVVSGSSPSWSR